MKRGLIKYMLCAALLLMLGSVTVYADPPQLPQLSGTPEMKIKGYRGFYRFVDEYGDTCRMTVFNDFYVYPPLKFKNKKQEEFYWRTVRDVPVPQVRVTGTGSCQRGLRRRAYGTGGAALAPRDLRAAPPSRRSGCRGLQAERSGVLRARRSGVGMEAE